MPTDIATLVTQTVGFRAMPVAAYGTELRLMARATARVCGFLANGLGEGAILRSAHYPVNDDPPRLALELACGERLRRLP